jgi:hypothetical protein
VERLRTLLVGLGSGEPVADQRWQRVTLPTTDRMSTFLAAARRIADAGIAVEDMGLRRPSLDDVFLTLTDGDQSTAAPGTENQRVAV